MSNSPRRTCGVEVEKVAGDTIFNETASALLYSVYSLLKRKFLTVQGEFGKINYWYHKEKSVLFRRINGNNS